MLRTRNFGDIQPALQAEIGAAIVECCGRLATTPPENLELWLFDTEERRQARLARERLNLRLPPGGEGLPVAHDAWSGHPRITVCVEKLSPLPEPLRLGMLRVAAAHAVLHGSPDYYIFTIPADVVKEARQKGLPPPVLQQLLYQVATAVKSWAVARALARHGYLGELVAVALDQLGVTDDDRLAWELAEREPLARALYLALQLRPILFAQPLLARAPVLIEAIQALVAHLPAQDQWRLRETVAQIAAALSGEVRQDVGVVLRLALDGLL